MSEENITIEFFLNALNNLKSLILEINKAIVSQLSFVGPEYSGKANKLPWSGFWWPFLEGPGPNMYDSNGPLDKYDAYVKAVTGKSGQTVNWENTKHKRQGHELDASWAGHCNGWASAAILETEPTQPKVKQGITFDVGDLKGLMSEAHWFDNASPALKITNNAHVFHKTLIDYVGNGLAVIMDVSLGNKIFNHPVAQYQITYKKDAGDPNKTHVTCTIWFISDYVTPDYVGSKGYPSEFGREYTYWLKGDVTNPVDGGWEGVSVSDHPDAIWRPLWSDAAWHGPFGSGKPTYLIDIMS